MADADRTLVLIDPWPSPCTGHTPASAGTCQQAPDVHLTNCEALLDGIMCMPACLRISVSGTGC